MKLQKLVLPALVFAAITLSSCEKKYTCKYPLLPKTTYKESDYTDQEIEAYKNSCINSGGTWSSN